MPELMKKPISTTLAAPGSQSHSHNSNEPTSALEIVAPGTLSKLGLESLNEQQLGETFTKLNTARLSYQRLSGVCATLQGLVLIQAKETVGHGNYGLWISEHFPKSDETARKFTLLAEDFLAKSQPKLEFESPKGKKSPVSLLLAEAIQHIDALNSETLDLNHPVVRAVEEYVNERTSTQLWFDLKQEKLPDQRGGFRPTKKNGAPRAEKRTDAEIARDEYEEHAPAVCRRTAETMVELLLLEGPGKERAWDILDDEELDKLKLQAHDLYEGALASQKRRKALRK